jgi:hypothetical protein
MNSILSSLVSRRSLLPLTASRVVHIRCAHFVRSTRELRSVNPLASFTFVALTAFAPLVNSARSISRNSEVKSRETTRDPSTPGTDIAHKSVLNITPSVKMEHDIMSNMGARNAGVCFLGFIIARDDARP